MEYKRIEDKIVFRLEMGDGLMESAQKIAAAEGVKLASINGIGACSKIIMGYIDLNKKEYVFKKGMGVCGPQSSSRPQFVKVSMGA